MRKLTHIMVFAISIALALVSQSQAQSKPSTTKNTNAFELEVIPNKSSYALGEVVGIRFHLLNTLQDKISINAPNVLIGNLRLKVSDDGILFRDYVGPDWGMLDSFPRQIDLLRGQKLEHSTDILFNHTLPYAHLSSMYAEKVRRKRVDTDYVFARAGSYWLKASYHSHDYEIESKPRLIQITEPKGLDAKVWNAIKNDRAMAYYLHTGDVMFHPNSEQAKNFKKRIEALQKK